MESKLFSLQARRRLFVVFASSVALASALLVLDYCFPLPQPGQKGALIVLAADGTPLRAFPDRDHVWRNPITLEQVSPDYIDVLLHYEDHTFWWNPGINPVALTRAAWQWLRYRRIISGGSTLTMQVARILDPVPHTISGKLHQMLRALQLEAHDSKREIVQLYLNYAPMGGVIEGVEAASRTYLGKSAAYLSPAEAAMLTVLPQAPSLLRPDRYPNRARHARNKVIRRMKGYWSTARIDDALTEPVTALPAREPLLAPLLAERLRLSMPGRTRIVTLIDPQIQTVMEQLLDDRVHTLPHAMSIAALVMDNASLAVLAYAGTAEYADPSRSGYVDMIRASRSPGSTLKPFLYGFALDDGLIHSESLLVDAPQSFHGYNPSNFQGRFHGPVSVSEALVDSLNVPAVDLLDRLGSANFLTRLRQGGLQLRLPANVQPNLSIILGGGGTTLENLVGAYRALAHGGLAGTPRLVPDDPLIERRMMSAGAAFIVRDILATGGDDLQSRAEIPGVAWKTGTSFGYRDSWAIGVSPRYTIGIWVGRPDGTPSPGFYGASTAQPLLMQAFATLPRDAQWPSMSDKVSRATICWPLGRRETDDDETLCQFKHKAWLLNGTAPPTLPDRLRDGPAELIIDVDTKTGLRVNPQCSQGTFVQHTISRWPLLSESWLDAATKRRSLPPDWAPGCQSTDTHALHIEGARDQELLIGRSGAPLKLHLDARGAESRVHWLLNGLQVAVSGQDQALDMLLTDKGINDITAIDEAGHSDRIQVHVDSAAHD